MRTNYVLIDYENVQPDAMSVLDKEHFRVIVFVGANQAKVTFEVASVLQQLGSRAEYVKISGNGSNALDFHIAYYIGVLASKEPDAFFHIVSRDSGFDPLITHLKAKKILASRSIDVTEIPIVKAASSRTPNEKIDVIVADLKRRGASKPRAVKTLTSTISSMFQKQITDQELQSLIGELKSRGLVKVTGTKVSYSLPS
ncbi:PIN domain-containing protein [Nitrogeniibacter aestuarii]|uniref:PIN domain-containing protein n=1 Tax=Nitrogeniibacter aestuarii TaxID=2815343 RepID=UPI001D0F6FC6|nr:PIN domain-containing protein [Nitrogeniibacter aestuarii]